ncbi:MAG: hypothetical protein LQ346_007452, partial [Caloplaca aetnensis]
MCRFLPRLPHLRLPPRPHQTRRRRHIHRPAAIQHQELLHQIRHQQIRAAAHLRGGHTRDGVLDPERLREPQGQLGHGQLRGVPCDGQFPRAVVRQLL